MNLFASSLVFLLAFAAFGAVNEGKQRAKNVRDLGKGGADSIPEIQPYLHDPDATVRLEAVKALVQISGKRSLGPLMEATRDNDPEVQIRAVEGLVNFYLPGYVKTGVTGSFQRAGSAIKSRFDDSNSQVVDGYVQVRPEVVQAIGKVASGGGSMDARASAARAAGILRGREAVPDLTDSLRAKDSRLIYECLIALQKIRDNSAGPPVRFLLRDPDERVKLAAIQTSGILADHGAVNDLRDALDRSRSDRVKRTALQSLALIADPSTHDLFRTYLSSGDDVLRTYSAEGLARLRNDADGAMIERIYNAEDKGGPRLAEAFALVRYGNTDMTEFGVLRYLVNQLNSAPNRDAAVAYLSEAAHDKDVRNALYPDLQNSAATRSEKTGLAEVLSAGGHRDALPYLDALAKDPDPDVAQAALRASRNLNARL